MGTNYYLYRDTCEHCGCSKLDRLHIGKSSSGWCFGLHVRGESWEDEKLPHSLDEWVVLWSEPGAVIRNEYGDVVRPDDMLSIITQRDHSDAPPMTDEWLRTNHAMRGPKGLARSAYHSVPAPGDATYDLVRGDFS